MTILEAIKEAAEDDTEVIYEQLSSADAISNHDFSYAIIIMGETAYAEILGDRTDLTIPFNGSEMISLVASKNPIVAMIFLFV